MHTKAHNDKVTALLLLSLLVTSSIYLAFHTHPYGDDYCTAYQWKLGADWYEYLRSYWDSWSGRWATFIVRYIYFDVIGLTANRYWIVTVAAVFSILFGFSLASRLLYSRSSVAFIWSILCTVIFIALASAIDALLFWMTGVVDYTLGYFFVPLALWLTVIAISDEKRPSWWLMLAAGICLFWSSGFSELFLLPVACFLLGSLFISRRKVRVVFLGSFALAGTLVNILAPGNANRAGLSNLDTDFSEMILGTLFYGFRGLLLPILALAILSSLPFMSRTVKQLVSLAQRHLDHKLIILVASFAMLYPFAIEFALFWSLGAPGPGRAHNISLFTLILSWPVILAALNLKFSPVSFPLPAYGRAVVLLVAIGLLFAINPLKMVRDIVSGSSNRYHQTVSSAEHVLMLPENQGKDIVLPTSDLVTTDKNHYVNKCLAGYFSVNTVMAATEKGSREYLLSLR